MRDMQQDMLPDRQAFAVIRIEDNQFIQWEATMKEAVATKEAYEATYNEPCRIGRTFISGEETVAQRTANEQE